MSEPQAMSAKELRLVIRLLSKLRDTANHITMTGGLQGGEQYLQQQYDAILASLAEQGISLPRYFPPLPPDANPGMLGIAADQVAEYLTGLIEPDEGETAAASFFDRFFAKGDFSHIGEAMREAMPDWMRARRGEAPGAGPEGATQAAAAPATGAAADAIGELERRMTGLNARLQAVADQMRQEGLSPEDQQRLAAELSALAREQAQMAQVFATRKAERAGH
jgi:hypothetical protein